MIVSTGSRVKKKGKNIGDDGAPMVRWIFSNRIRLAFAGPADVKRKINRGEWMTSPWQHPKFTRRDMLQAGAIGLMGLSMTEVNALRAFAPSQSRTRPRAVIYIFLSGGLGQHDSFDLKPDAPESIRGEFEPIRTR